MPPDRGHCHFTFLKRKENLAQDVGQWGVGVRLLAGGGFRDQEDYE
jgi:hypothetical protein